MNNKDRPTYVVEGGKVRFSLCKDSFQREAIAAAAQSMTAKYFIEMRSIDSEKFGIILEPIKGTQDITDEILCEAAKEFCNKVLDEQVRIDLEKRYGKIREMIVRQAFSPVTMEQLSREINN